jgi:hypothetical protein
MLANAFEVPSNSLATKKFAWIGFRHPLDTYFAGREDELAKLQGYQSNESVKVAVISGLGGMGKSLLAFRYAKLKKDSTNCVWLRGEDKDTLFNSVTNLARELKLQTNNSNGTQEQFEGMLIGIRSKINNSDQPWLIILDNVDSMHEFVTPTINAVSKEPNVFIIVTSVLRKVASKRKTAVLLELSGFSDGDADKFIKERLDNRPAELNRELSTTLQSLPLAMDQAVQYIRDQRNNSFQGNDYGIEEFLEEFNNQKCAMGILDYKLEENEKTIFTTVKMCSAKIQALESGEDTVFLLHILSYLDPDGVSLSFLEGLMCIIEGTMEFLQNRLIILKDYSLISVENKTITIHRVVQRIVPLIQFAAAQRLLKRVAIGTFKYLSISKLTENEIRQAPIVWNHLKKVDIMVGSILDYQCEIDRWLLQLDLPVLFTQKAKDTFALLGDLLDQKVDTLDFRLERTSACASIAVLINLIQLQILQTRLAESIEKQGQKHPDVLYVKTKIIISQRAFKMDVNYLEEHTRLIAIAEEQLEKGHLYTLGMKLSFAMWLYEDKKFTHALYVAKDIRSFFEASDPLYQFLGKLQINCYKALRHVIRTSELLEEQTTKLDEKEFSYLMNDTRPTHPNEDLSGDEEEYYGMDVSLVKGLFPEVFELLSEFVFKANKRKRSELRSSIKGKKNDIAAREGSQNEDGVHLNIVQTRLSAITDAQRTTIIRFRKFFTDERNLLKAMEIFDCFLATLKGLLSKE